MPARIITGSLKKEKRIIILQCNTVTVLTRSGKAELKDACKLLQ